MDQSLPRARVKGRRAAQKFDSRPARDLQGLCGNGLCGDGALPRPGRAQLGSPAHSMRMSRERFLNRSRGAAAKDSPGRKSWVVEKFDSRPAWAPWRRETKRRSAVASTFAQTTRKDGARGRAQLGSPAYSIRMSGGRFPQPQPRSGGIR